MNITIEVQGRQECCPALKRSCRPVANKVEWIGLFKSEAVWRKQTDAQWWRGLEQKKFAATITILSVRTTQDIWRYASNWVGVKFNRTIRDCFGNDLGFFIWLLQVSIFVYQNNSTVQFDKTLTQSDITRDLKTNNICTTTIWNEETKSNYHGIRSLPRIKRYPKFCTDCFCFLTLILGTIYIDTLLPARHKNSFCSALPDFLCILCTRRAVHWEIRWFTYHRERIQFTSIHNACAHYKRKYRNLSNNPLLGLIFSSHFLRRRWGFREGVLLAA